MSSWSKTNPRRTTSDSRAVTAATTISADIEDGGSSGGGEETTSTAPSQEAAERIQIANRENKAVCYLRALLFFVLLTVAAAVSCAVYVYTRHNDSNNFQDSFAANAFKVVDSFKVNAARRLEEIESLAIDITSTAKAEGQTWPNVTYADFERRLAYTIDLAAVISVILLPLVTKETRQEWEAFSVENQGWIKEGLALQGDIAAKEDDEEEYIEVLESTWGSSPNLTIPEAIFRVNGTSFSAETGDGPYFPWWQFAPVFPVPSLVNYNTMSHPTRRPNLIALMETEQVLVSEAWDYADTSASNTVGKKAALNLFLNRRGEEGLSYQDGPVSDLYFPIFDDHKKEWKLLEGYEAPQQLVGALACYVYWQVYFEDILPPSMSGQNILALLENSCGQQYSYLIDGEDASYMGQGDLHDPKYDDLAVSTGWHAFLDGVGDSEDRLKGQCIYKVTIYPTIEMENAYNTNTPLYFTLVLVGTFLLTSLVFYLYDVYVEKRQRVVMQKAVQSTEVVQSLFPKAVRDRLFEDGDAHGSPGAGTIRNGYTSNGSDEQDDAIADLYNDCTVFFADLAGFTTWSASREPKAVFHLLEILYGAFDAIAIRRRVFKVETIGDCYLAITGVPNPQERHALIMCRFASECLNKMNLLVQNKLAQELGEDTAKLQLRVGVHSGDVTAGVLRGDKARFQLFGDTVNTASRMESTGVPGRIQCSVETAEYLRKAGKSSWLTERENGVEAKGKGRLQTFFVSPGRDASASASSSSVISFSSSDSG